MFSSLECNLTDVEKRTRSIRLEKRDSNDQGQPLQAAQLER